MKRNIVKAQVGAILNEPEVIGSVPVPYDHWWDRLLCRLRLKRARIVELAITGATASTNFKITSIIEDIVVESDRTGADSKMWHLMNANIMLIVEILAVAIHNKPGAPPSWLTHALSHSFSQEQLREIMQNVYGRLGVEDFFGTLDLVRSLKMDENDILETTPSMPSLEE